MSEVIDQAVAILNEKMGDGIEGTAKFVLSGEGSIIVDSDGARAGDDEADVTLTADADVFQNILSGDQNPTSAFMTGKLKVDGNMGMAMKMAGQLG
ncbi:SCP2 sterol-binding domain-containing protein [Thalassobium sp. R2A62]|jgi:putative sterol carrier protein|uniref:SCP2 sterol-binding domain-containing protein n=1 Tax=Thalassobium sp. R2A62 TaxID=633131 RepID=UPI0001B1D42F|nr:SCP2 sterol-binding domain-containing protein [Thalassobium sp. R2A62]EET49028.1 sterol-binding domain protein [Thalassobium sp. R2A62]MDG1341191.1 SCP2 sterol-binding domain-containing protein [Paracoccaceae bacterium]MDG2452904.1 SCP2 sterol-binding domain-containing protein [Paracoccaceae bacterium]